MAAPVAKCILVIEDESLIADAVAARLRSEGYDVSVTGDGPSGVALCTELEPALVIVDLMLPGLDGLEVCRRIQKAHLPARSTRSRADPAGPVQHCGQRCPPHRPAPWRKRRIEVTDHGPGIAEENRARVFERFYREDESRTAEQGSAC